MASGIEHRKADTLLQSYLDYDCPNFSIWNGKRLCVVYDQGNCDEGYQALQGFVNAITASNTGAVYTLRVYPETVTEIKSNTEYKGSTTFMLSPFEPTATGQNGTVIMTQGPGVPAKIDPAVNAKLAALEAKNDDLIKKLHNQEIQQLRTEFTNQIAGLNKEPEKTWVDRFFDIIEKKPEIIKDTLSGIGKVINQFIKEPVNYIQNTSPSQVAGTTHTTVNMETETEMKLTSEGALINPFIVGEENNLSSDDQNKLVVERLAPLDQEAHDTIQSDCMEVIEKRIGAATLSRMLIVVACMSNKNLNKLLANLD